jgi:hypothetical protein
MNYQVKIEKMGVHAYIIPSFSNGGRKLFRFKGKALVCLAEEKLDDFLVKLRLLVEEKMVESSVRLELNHDEENNSPKSDPPKFPLQLTSRGQMPMKKND